MPMVSIQVTFDIDANGIVNVTAKDLGTNKEQKITITSNTTLSDDEIDRMMKEAEANKEADKKKKEEADLRNDAEQMIFQSEKALKDLGDKVDSKEKEEVENIVKELKEALEKNDMDKVKTIKENLQEKAMNLSAKVYEQVNKERAELADTNTTEDSNNKKDSDVKDADYEEK